MLPLVEPEELKLQQALVGVVVRELPSLVVLVVQEEVTAAVAVAVATSAAAAVLEWIVLQPLVASEVARHLVLAQP